MAARVPAPGLVWVEVEAASVLVRALVSAPGVVPVQVQALAAAWGLAPPRVQHSLSSGRVKRLLKWPVVSLSTSTRIQPQYFPASLINNN
jgi:hypothetical protein